MSSTSAPGSALASPIAGGVTRAMAGSVRAPVVLFTATIFLNAFLLFLVQPLFSKQVLPLLGGTPAVWTTCLLFFQAMLLLGYLYAHLATRYVPARVQPATHVALLLASLLSLPIGLPADWTPPASSSPVVWLLHLLTVSLGLHFFVLSAGAPLLQRWFARTGHPRAHNPYFLYAASNLGSFVALLGYPFVVEPWLPLSAQTRTWSAGYVLLAMFVGACAVLATRGWRAMAGTPGAAAEAALGADEADDIDVAPVTWRRRTRWILLALVPSSLLAGVTTYLTTDVAAIPLLWVVPLALYLLTFVLVFARRPPLPEWVLLRAQALLVVPLLLVMGAGRGAEPWTMAPLHLLAFFACAMVCHTELARTRPSVKHLTEFYLWIAVGGLLGSVVNVLVAPVLFSTVLEYPLMLVAACLLRRAGPVARDDAAPIRAADAAASAQRRRELDLVLPLVLFATLAILADLHPEAEPWRTIVKYGSMAIVALVVFSFSERRLRFGLAAAALVLAPMLGRTDETDLVYRARSFFGVYEVRRNGRYHTLTHGTTLHGGQSLNPVFRREPLTYYHRGGPLGQLFAHVGDTTTPRHVAVVGLGTGTAACYARPGDRWTFYEIDPLVARIARDSALFSYIADCAPDARVVLGDARRELAAEPDHAYDLIVLDAFSSDAIPVHLLTREALALYLRKLAPDGVVAVHISNRYLDLQPVLTELARDQHVAGAWGTDVHFTEKDRGQLRSRSYWVALAPRAPSLARLTREPGWTPLPPRAATALWTDDFSNVLRVFRWRR